MTDSIKSVAWVQGLRALVKARPEDPFEFLAKYLQENKPAK